MNLTDKIIVAFLAVFFFFAGVDKALHIHGFVNAINDYKFLPVPVGLYLAPLIIAAELAIAIGFLRSCWRQTAALQSAALMTVFTIALAGNRVLGSRGICGCWFSINMAEGNAHFLLNGIIIGLSLLLWYTWRTATRRSTELEQEPTTAHSLPFDTESRDEAVRIGER